MAEIATQICVEYGENYIKVDKNAENCSQVKLTNIGEIGCVYCGAHAIEFLVS